MKTEILVSLIAVLAVMSLVAVSASDSLSIGSYEVKLNGIAIDPGVASVAGEAGEVVPVSIQFTADENASDVQVSAWIQGRRSDAVESDFRDLISGKDYVARLSLTLPTDIDPEEDLTLFVRIESDEGTWEREYTVSMQRQSYNADILFVESDNIVDAGSSMPVDVVIKNLGRHDLEDLVVAVSVPELGISKRAYFGDLTPTDVCSEDNNDNCDNQDAVEGKIYLNVPANVKAGTYTLVVEAHTSKIKSAVKKTILIVGSEQASDVLVPVMSKELKAGETATYKLIIVNSGSKLGVYEIIPETVEGVVVTATEPIVTVSAGESKVVDVEVKAGDKQGTYSFALNVNSDNQLVKRVTLSANVGAKGTGKVLSSNITVLTIILAIIFVVLLVVLVVLLTRKPSKTEELEESYY